MASIAVEDASGGTSKAAHDAAIRRIEQAVPCRLPLCRCCSNSNAIGRARTYEEVIAVVKEHCGTYGQAIEYAATMVQKAPASRKRQPSIPR